MVYIGVQLLKKSSNNFQRSMMTVPVVVQEYIECISHVWGVSLNNSSVAWKICTCTHHVPKITVYSHISYSVTCRTWSLRLLSWYWVDMTVAVSHGNFIQCGLWMHVQYGKLMGATTCILSDHQGWCKSFQLTSSNTIPIYFCPFKTIQKHIQQCHN